MSDKPSYIQGRPVLNAKQIDELDHEYRTRVEALLAVDEGVEGIVKALAERGDLANTYIFFMSDNGCLLGQHRWPRGKTCPTRSLSVYRWLSEAQEYPQVRVSTISH